MSAFKVFVLLAGVAVSASVAAQSLDPNVLNSLQSQLGAGEGVPSSASSQTTARSLTTQPAGRVDTLEEQEVRRAEARMRLQQLYYPSQIEADYRRRVGDDSLRQFGYDYFQSAPPPSGVRTGAISDSYVLGIGDEIQISFRGSVNRSQTVRVDRDGRILASGLSPVVAAGRTLSSVRNELQAETRRTMLATDVFVSVGDVRAVSVFVGGEVERPGQFGLTSVSDVATAIAHAGGIRRSGSLRQVRVVRAGGGTVVVDLYGLLGIGTPPSIQLRDGDRVIVPVVGPTVAVTGGVARPGIYELKGPASVAQVVAFAGGAIRQRGAQVVISRIGNEGSENFLRAQSASTSVMGGDAVQVIGSSPGGATGRVSLAGHVDNVGPRPLVSARTIAELVGSAQDLRSDTYQMAAVLVRRDASSGARVFNVVNLASEIRGMNSTTLQSEDRLYVFSRKDIEFLNSTSVRKIVLGQLDNPNSCKSLQRLHELVQDSEASRFNAVTRGGLVMTNSKGAELGAMSAIVGMDGASATEGGLALAAREQSKKFVPNEAQNTNSLSYMGRTVVDEQSFCPVVFEEEPELLPLLLEHSISVGGAVRRPGAYPVGGTVTARDMSLVADGILAGSRGLVLDVNRSDVGNFERIEGDDANTHLASTTLLPGDDVRFNAMRPRFEASGVLLTGEVARPGLYTIRKGETLSQLLARAGGMSENAYPYGTVFSRVSVKKAQEEGYRRTARELNNSLLALAARSQGNGNALAGASELIRTLSEVEASGRMVVEADPRVLELRPDLDTILEGGDSIHLPKRPNYVIALGDVNNPGAIQFVEGKTVDSYLREAGGELRTADSKRAFVVLPNGSAQPLAAGHDSRLTPPPGSTIIVPKNIDPLYKLNLIRDVTAIIAQVSTSIATVAVLATR